jgi:hypothetical protein
MYEPAEEAAFRLRLLTHPGERQDIDYKASKPFAKDDDFSLKLIRHIQGMANVGGGWLVIGFEDANPPTPDPGHSELTRQSYDPTPVNKVANSYVEKGQQLSIDVYFETHPNTGLGYPVIRVRGFERLPYVCRSTKNASDTGKEILRQGSVYVRRPGAETVAISRPEDWDAMISRCVRLRRDEFLNEFRELLERMGSPPPTPPPAVAAELRKFMEEMRGKL